MTVQRPAVRWHGGKWLLAPWIIGHFPPHQVYTEAFGGGASVLLRKSVVKSEIYNDLDEDVVNLFRVLRGPEGDELIRQVKLTPFARVEFDGAYVPQATALDRARALLIRSFMGFGTNGHQRRTGFRSKGYRVGKLPQHDWRDMHEAMWALIDRLRNVVIECRPAVEVLQRYDEAGAVHYVDPPYVMATRGHGADYAHELTDAQHVELLKVLRGLQGRVLLSGYACALYDEALRDWRRVERRSLADGARERIEVIWMNFEGAPAGPLFEAP